MARFKKILYIQNSGGGRFFTVMVDFLPWPFPPEPPFCLLQCLDHGIVCVLLLLVVGTATLHFQIKIPYKETYYTKSVDMNETRSCEIFQLL